jgi:hypothetical protein
MVVPNQANPTSNTPDRVRGGGYDFDLCPSSITKNKPPYMSIFRSSLLACGEGVGGGVFLGLGLEVSFGCIFSYILSIYADIYRLYIYFFIKTFRNTNLYCGIYYLSTFLPTLKTNNQPRI